MPEVVGLAVVLVLVAPITCVVVFFVLYVRNTERALSDAIVQLRLRMDVHDHQGSVPPNHISRETLIAQNKRLKEKMEKAHGLTRQLHGGEQQRLEEDNGTERATEALVRLRATAGRAGSEGEGTS